jgi:hypothetical protein
MLIDWGELSDKEIFFAEKVLSEARKVVRNRKLAEQLCKEAREIAELAKTLEGIQELRDSVSRLAEIVLKLNSAHFNIPWANDKYEHYKTLKVLPETLHLLLMLQAQRETKGWSGEVAGES